MTGWLTALGRRSGRADRPAPVGRIVVLPHAGGWPSAFRSWMDLVPHDVELLAAQLPGRGPRSAEEPLRRTGPIVAALADALAARDPLPTVVVGHSFGSVLAYELTRSLERRGAAPRLVAVSARQPPCFPSRPPYSHCLPDDELVRHVHRIGGAPDGVADVGRLLRPSLPAIRADLEALETYRRPPTGTSIPIVALCATDDPIVIAERMFLWSVETTSGFRRLSFDGGHFYLYRRPVAEVVVPVLTDALRGDPAVEPTVTQAVASSA
ncbi:alpha/beta fold hydrolase [Pseudonocardia sp. DR1-2]|uniref:thioesterase II family protein n=1 Tax=Pseudonocardia sp. DR1-2 TaxID=2951168 RepID=UPI0020436A4D|nr:alpha/beta fold hydrolase [Pseudonocardia sp. DR1-2]MCM3849805.1 alpha/beta fold hydrolase [Pseudonocardia sp. DR1-2]